MTLAQLERSDVGAPGIGGERGGVGPFGGVKQPEDSDPPVPARGSVAEFQVTEDWLGDSAALLRHRAVVLVVGQDRCIAGELVRRRSRWDGRG